MLENVESINVSVESYNVEPIEKRIVSIGVLGVAVANIQKLSHEEYALARKNYFGASDSSILCGVNLYKQMSALIKEKNTKELTKEEIEVSEKPIVRKGYDLEAFILNYAEGELNNPIWKPKDMYKFENIDGLSVNYDGVCDIDGRLIPVEAKLVSKFGEKYYNKSITVLDARDVDMSVEGDSLEQHITKKALKFGIPAYYYTQVQQEIAGLNAPYGYLTARFDESWTQKTYLIKRDDYVINGIFNRCEKYIKEIKRD